MTDKQKQYYFEMAKRNRLIQLKADDRNAGLITFFIGTNSPKYLENEPWGIIDDEPKTGDIFHLEQLLTDKHRDNPYISLDVWRDIKDYIRENFKSVKQIRWDRFKNGRSRTYLVAL